MKKYRVYFKKVIEEHYYVDVDAEDGKDAMKIVDSGRHIVLKHTKDPMMDDNAYSVAEEYEEL